MQVEVGQLRVWDDAITNDKTPFLVIEMNGEITTDCVILWKGKIDHWGESRVMAFSEVIDEAG